MQTTTTAPSRRYEAVAMIVAAEQVEVTDEYRAAIVEDVKVGTKWVTFRDAEGKKIDEVLKGTEVAVIRQVETKESIDARRRVVALQMVEKSLADYQPKAPEAAKTIAERTAKGHMVSSFDLDRLIEGQAVDQVMAGFQEVVENFAKSGKDALEAHAAYSASLQQQILSSMSGGGVYRSSSVVSNRMDEALVAAKADFIQSGLWM